DVCQRASLAVPRGHSDRGSRPAHPPCNRRPDARRNALGRRWIGPAQRLLPWAAVSRDTVGAIPVTSRSARPQQPICNRCRGTPPRARGAARPGRAAGGRYWPLIPGGSRLGRLLPAGSTLVTLLPAGSSLSTLPPLVAALPAGAAAVPCR